MSNQKEIPYLSVLVPNCKTVNGTDRHQCTECYPGYYVINKTFQLQENKNANINLSVCTPCRDRKYCDLLSSNKESANLASQLIKITSTSKAEALGEFSLTADLSIPGCLVEKIVGKCEYCQLGYALDDTGENCDQQLMYPLAVYGGVTVVVFTVLVVAIGFLVYRSCIKNVASLNMERRQGQFAFNNTAGITRAAGNVGNPGNARNVNAQRNTFGASANTDDSYSYSYSYSSSQDDDWQRSNVQRGNVQPEGGSAYRR